MPTPTIFRRLLPAALLVLGLGACTKNFDDINTDPNKPLDVPANLVFTRAQKWGTLYDNDEQLGEHLHANMWVQFFANSTASFQTDRYENNDSWVSSLWNDSYANFGADIQQAIRLTAGKPEDVNRHAQARIWKVFIMHRITDYWGDVPYFDAFKGGTEGVTMPAYDKQEDIYADLLKELKEAAAEMDDAKTGNYGAADLIYGNPASLVYGGGMVAGVNTKWRKFANSLRLRLALRISKANPALAEQNVREALAADVMTTSADAAIMTNASGLRIAQNPLATVLNFNDSRISKTIVDQLRSTNDPRLPLYVGVAPGAAATAPDSLRYRGLPNGLSAAQLATPRYASAARDFSTAGPLFLQPANPQLILTYAEVCFLRAEATLKGWDSGTGTRTAQQWYEAGVQEAITMRPFNLTATAAKTYLAQPGITYNAANALNQIITQKWLSMFGNNGFEAYAEYRRTGFPVLRPGASLGQTNGAVPRRLLYPATEANYNPTGLAQAIAHQGPNLLTTRMWWDK